MGFVIVQLTHGVLDPEEEDILFTVELGDSWASWSTWVEVYGTYVDEPRMAKRSGGVTKFYEDGDTSDREEGHAETCNP